MFHSVQIFLKCKVTKISLYSKHIHTMELYNGINIPDMGFGTYRMPAEDTEKSVLCALKNGWRHIDTAAFYGNEREVGAAVRDSGLKREEVFVTSKLWNTERGYETTLKAFDKTLEALGFDYLDLYLIHWPASPFYYDNWKQLNSDTWRAFEKLYREGRIRAIGLSNFMPRHALPLLETAEIKPMVNQIEFHPGWMQKDCLEFCKANGMVVEAWAPLIKGDVLENGIIAETAARHGCSPAQVVLKWVLSCGVIPLCKSVTPSRIAENLHSPEVELSEAEIDAISSLSGCGGRCYNPDCVNFL